MAIEILKLLGPVIPQFAKEQNITARLRPFARMSSGAVILALSLFLNSGDSGSFVYAQTQKEETPATPPASSKAAPQPIVMKRLPKEIRPRSYSIYLEPDIDQKVFTGRQTIFITVDKPVKEIVLNSLDLDIWDGELARVGDGPRSSWSKLEVVKDIENQQVRLISKTSLPRGEYELRMEFEGRFNDKLVGFYLSSCKDENGNELHLASTQMEPSDARRVFPCFDEPDMKASFKITLAVAPEMVAISNARLKFEKFDQRLNKKIFTFEETPVMSTYLVALIVGPFQATEPVNKNGVEIRVWAPRGKIAQGIYGRDAAASMLPFFEKYFGDKYPLRKLDLIAIPDFAPGAMENLGAITFRESLLLVDDATASTKARQHVASVIAHEMAHMWFGDLVTMKWWDDLWLNEAFATWMAVKAMDYFNPDWRPWDMFVEEKASALSTDCLHSTRPIYAPVANPSDAEEMFDEITYEKGAAVLRMLERYLGEDVYMKGIQHYIATHKFSNASTSQLWESLEKVSGKPVGRIMQNWVYEPGYPLIEVKRSAASKSDNNKESDIIYEISQKRFLLEVDKSSKKSDKSRKLGNSSGQSTSFWQVPLGIRTINSNEEVNGKTRIEPLLLKEKSTTIKLPAAERILSANAQADGYFRVSYPVDMLMEIAAGSQETLTATERYQLLSDAWALVEYGKLPIGDYLAFTAEYQHEHDPNVVALLIKQMRIIDLFVADENRADFAAFVRSRLGEIKSNLGWEAQPGDSDLVRLLRGKVLHALGTIGEDQRTISEARERFEIYCQSPEKLDPNLYDAIVSTVAYNGERAQYEKIAALWREAGSPEAKIRNLIALGDFRDQELIGETLSLALTAEVKTQDAPHLILHIMSSTAGRDLAWSFIKDNWSLMESRFPRHLFPRLINGAKSFVSETRLAELRSFLADHPIRSGRRISAKVQERVALNVALNKLAGNKLNQWLVDAGNSVSASAEAGPAENSAGKASRQNSRQNSRQR